MKKILFIFLLCLPIVAMGQSASMRILQHGILDQDYVTEPVLPTNNISYLISYDDGSGRYYLEVSSQYAVSSDVTVNYSVDYTYNSVSYNMTVTRTIPTGSSAASYYYFGAGYSITNVSLISGSPASDSTYKYLY